MPQPLTKRDQHGNLYTRPAAVEMATAAALQEDLQSLVRRAQVSRRTSPDFIPLECLVHLLRDARRRGNESALSALMGPFLARCEAILNANTRDDTIPNAAEVRENILSELSFLFAEDGSGDNPDELDFFECRFNLAFSSLRADLIRGEIRLAKRVQSLPNGDVAGGSDAAPSDDEVFARVSEAYRTPARQEGNVFLADLLAAINTLPDDERDVVVLCHVLGYKAESEDPTEETAATRSGVTGRTIRKRLAKAAKKLSHFKEDKE